MRLPKAKDFNLINEWGLIENPLKAIDDYSQEKEEKRWNNKWHNQTFKKYKERRQDWSDLGEGEYTEYYKERMQRPIDKTKWEYLKKRKAWYICPLGWDNFATPGTSRILDLGCGDGDVTQRVANYIYGKWIQAEYSGFPMEIVGVDLNKTRIENAQKLCHSPNRNINLTFQVGDAISGLGYDDNYFDYTLMSGVIEILDDDEANKLLNEVKRITANGIYIQDLFDKFPGGNPRENLKNMLSNRGFENVVRYKVFSQPFTEQGSSDPMEIWPITVNQIIYAERENKIDVTDKYENR